MPSSTGGGSPDHSRDLGVDATTRKCPDCGESHTGSTHSNCPSGGGTLKRSPSAKSRLDDLPPEAQLVANDPSRLLNQYLLVKQIGKGGMGTVWKAWDKRLTRWVAIKFLTASEEEDVMRFQREAKLAARLRHPNIAPIYEVGEAPAMMAGQSARHYLCMEFIDGDSLAAVQLTMKDAIEVFMKVAQGVEAAHKAGVIHRDLKPQNVMLTSDHWPYVMDFGLAKSMAAESSLSVSGAVMGTPAYMPPEQAQGQLTEIDARSDVYSLGATMYAVLCRKPPFTGQTQMEVLMKVCKEPPISPRTHVPEIPEPIERIILKCMAKVKADRYASAGEMANDIKRYLANEEVSAKAIAPTKPPGGGKTGLIVGIAAAAVVAIAAVAFVAMKKPEGGQVKDPLLVPSTTASTAPSVAVAPPVTVVAPPPPVTVAPPVNEAREREEKWMDTWRKLRPKLDIDDWKAGDAGVSGSARRQISVVEFDAPSWISDVIDWFGVQVGKADAKVKGLGGSFEEKREACARIVAWCDTIINIVGNVEQLSAAGANAKRVREAAAKLADYKGNFHLKVFVGPFAQITKITRDGKPVQIAQAHTPVVMANLEIGDYEIELSHPQAGKKILKVPTAQLKDGKFYMISGKIQDARIIELP